MWKFLRRQELDLGNAEGGRKITLYELQASRRSALPQAAMCCAQTDMHILVVEALLIAIYSTWGTSKYL
jgi:hypothetical protein